MDMTGHTTPRHRIAESIGVRLQLSRQITANDFGASVRGMSAVDARNPSAHSTDVFAMYVKSPSAATWPLASTIWPAMHVTGRHPSAASTMQ
eukprot:523156-Rhodomonas_salina.1